MTIRVTPTLDLMAAVYRMSRDGGNRSPRFLRYVEAAAQGAPISGFNPMTSKPVLATIEALLALRTEDLVERAANRTATQFGLTDDVTMHLVVAAPGVWTDRLITEVHQRLTARDPGAVLWWYDEEPTVDRLEEEAAAQTFRCITARQTGAPTSLLEAVHQEGVAGMLSGRMGKLHEGAAEALEVLGDDPSLATMVGFLYGNDAAQAMGFSPIGLGERVGYAHAVALARETTNNGQRAAWRVAS